MLRYLARRTPFLGDILDARDRLRRQYDDLREKHFVLPGHFYSPIPDLEEVRRDADRIFAVQRTLPGIDTRDEEQLDLLGKLAPHIAAMPHGDTPGNGLRYGFDNPAYPYGDAIILWGMIGHLLPKRIIEIGSGHSSALMLDATDRFGAIDLTFIEPYPQLLQSLLQAQDQGRTTIIPERLQDVQANVFDQLGAGDILFIDSTHVSRIGSDVNRLIFEILPGLRDGVIVHIHDIFWPFEYPQSWVYEGRAWNEAYLVRAFLQDNPMVEVLMMNSYLEAFHLPFIQQHIPGFRPGAGASIWLRTIGRSR